MLNTNQQKEFLELLKPVQAGLQRYARCLTRNTEDARDLVSDTLLAAIDGFARLKKKESFKSYVFTIATRIFRRQKKRKRFFVDFNIEMAELIPDKSARTDARADVDILYAAMDKLPEKQKEAVALFEISGFSLEEIREIQGGTLSGVKSRLKRGREQLAVLLDADKYKILNYKNELQTFELNVYHMDSQSIANKTIAVAAVPDEM
jgi:RNA polymerase sigma-70 factor (ECF subfamily)